jgi:dolichyl-phosphate-mannose-protein mannosyltransferase
MVWDEPHSSANGMLFLRWYSSGFSDRRIINEGNQQLYGSFFNGVANVATRISPFGAVETIHLVIALTGIIGIVFAYRLAASLEGSRAGFLAATALALTPSYYGHSFINPKDLPFAVLFLASIYYLVRAYDELPRLRRRTIAALGIALGLTLGVRVGAVMLFGYFVVLVAAWAIARRVKARSYPRRQFAGDLRAAAKGFVIVAVIAWAIMLVWWPYAQLNPLLNPIRAMRALANFTEWPLTVLYGGRFIPSATLPWHYLPTSLLITLPEFYLLGLAVVLGGLLIRRFARQPARGTTDPDYRSKVGFVVFATAFPIVVAVATRPILYDGHRHFLFVIPLLAALLGVSLSRFFDMYPGLPTKIVTVLALTIAAITAIDMTRLHPYQYVFYNRSFGGLPHALGRYETDYWGESYKEGTEWLVTHYRGPDQSRRVRVANTSTAPLTSYYLEPYRSRFEQVSPREKPDVILATTRWNLHLKYPGRPLHVVERLGTPLLYVIETNQSGRP